MNERIQNTFLLQYSALILIVLSFLLASYSMRAVEQSPERAELINKPAFLNSTIQVPNLFTEAEVNLNSLKTIQSIIGNHDLDLHIELSGRSLTEQVRQSLQLQRALNQLGFTSDSFTVRASFTPGQKKELVRLSWSHK